MKSGLVYRILAMLLAVTLVSGCQYVNTENEKDLSGMDAPELYEAARNAMSKKRYEAAIEMLRTLEAQYPYGVYAEQAQLDTIYIYYLNDERGLALAAADRFIKLHPTHRSVDYAYYLKGLVSYQENDTLLGKAMGQDDLSDRDATAIRNAMVAFEELYTLFPDSQYAPEAKKRTAYLRNALAKNELAVAKYYYTRGAYVAVVNRCKGVVENYSNTPAVEQALALMMFSYEKMGFDVLSTDSRRVLELNFPESAFLTMDINKARFTKEDYSATDPTRVKDEDPWYATLGDWFTPDDETEEKAE